MQQLSEWEDGNNFIIINFIINYVYNLLFYCSTCKPSYCNITPENWFGLYILLLLTLSIKHAKNAL